MNVDHDCLYYHLHDFVDKHGHQVGGTLEIIPYCVRPAQELENEEIQTYINQAGSYKTFEQLREKKITVDQLYSWSAPIDIIEQYQLYIKTSFDSSSMSNQTFYNCSYPWFGQHCQYRFQAEGSLPQIVKWYLSFKDSDRSLVDPLSVTNHTCYKHLKCDFGSTPMCLDWREVCDGKFDCINDGIDELNCADLEFTICNEDEFQCHNGQCILMDLYRDDPMNPDCLDGTDEQAIERTICMIDPGFRCETLSSTKHGYRFPCGDGSDLNLPPMVINKKICNNQREFLVSQSILSHKKNSSLSHDCWLAMIFYFKLNYYAKVRNNKSVPCNDRIDSICLNFIHDRCPPELYVFPAVPVLFGHVYLLHSSNQSECVKDTVGFKYCPGKPEYVCYNQQLSPFIVPDSIHKMNDSVCSRFTDFIYGHKWSDILQVLKNIFGPRSRNVSITLATNIVGLFQCKNSSKYIPSRRLFDGIIDCYDGSDEDVKYSCSTNDKQHFRCTSEPKCISYLKVRDNNTDCLNGEDEQLTPVTISPIHFTFICDGFVDINFKDFMENRSIETDESDCEHWPCSNIYTRCDGFWSCKNGADELNCSGAPTRCAWNEHECISPHTYDIMCLPLHQAGDNHVDCLGGSDEPFFCRNDIPDFPGVRYHCWNSSFCISVNAMCDGQENCLAYGDDENFCENLLPNVGICRQNLIYINPPHYPNRELLCKLNEKVKFDIVLFFSLGVKTNIHSTIQSVERDKIISNPQRHLKLDWSELVGWWCNRGLFLWRRQMGSLPHTRHCICPPSYYGSRCQFQNQRVSVSFRVQTFELRTVFNVVIMLIDETDEIHSYEQHSFLSIRDCSDRMDVDLLYLDRPKDEAKTYSVFIDLFDKVTLKHRARWIFPIKFSFLPVYRISTILLIPFSQTTNPLIYSFNTLNTRTCAPGSVCLGFHRNRSICMCPLNKFGPRCLLTYSSCHPNPCNHGALCIASDVRLTGPNFTCLCAENYTGTFCEHVQFQLIILFSRVTIPQSVFIHTITVLEDAQPLRITKFKKIPYDQDFISVFTPTQYHAVFVEFFNNYYLIYAKANFNSSSSLPLPIADSDRCSPIRELFNLTVLSFHSLRRLKFYHIPCKERQEMKCFFDEEYMCLCTQERHPNCFEFDHEMAYNCKGSSYCQNGAQCFQDHPLCPASMMCVCAECFYGSQCQFSTKGVGLSLDAILGYQIRPHISFSYQPTIVKIATTVTAFIFVLGLISSISSLLTFQGEHVRIVGCGQYLFISSITSIFVMTIFGLKFLLLLFIQMDMIVGRSFLKLNCMTLDNIIRILLSIVDWLNACVGVERAIMVIRGINFDKAKSKPIANRVIFTVFFVAICSSIHDPLHRELVRDEAEQRTWCIVSYSSAIHMYNSAINFFHFFGPFFLNITSAVIIIITASRTRSLAKKQKSYRKHLREQIHQHKHLLISPVILVILAIPRLIISILTSCMKSARDPWLPLLSYFISYIPQLLTFIVFVLPSKTYKQAFANNLKIKLGKIKYRLNLRH